jgi:hypothetical protein
MKYYIDISVGYHILIILYLWEERLECWIANGFAAN